jgi:hypothetical protein
MEWTVETLTPPLKIPAPTNLESIHQHITTIESPSILPSTTNQDVNILNICTQEQNKRSLSDTTSQKSPSFYHFFPVQKTIAPLHIYNLNSY